MSAIKSLLNVRITTANDLCLIELSYRPLKDLVRYKQKVFFQKIIENRQGLSDDPLLFSMN